MSSLIPACSPLATHAASPRPLHVPWAASLSLSLPLSLSLSLSLSLLIRSLNFLCLNVNPGPSSPSPHFFLPWALPRPIMWELHTAHGARGGSESTFTSTSTSTGPGGHSSQWTPERAPLEEEEAARNSSSITHTSNTSSSSFYRSSSPPSSANILHIDLISPPQSSPEYSFSNPPSQPIDTLVHQLRRQSLLAQGTHVSASEPSGPRNPRSPDSLSDAGLVDNSNSPNDIFIEADPDDQNVLATPMSVPKRPFRFGRASDRSFNSIMSMISTGDQCNIRPPIHSSATYPQPQATPGLGTWHAPDFRGGTEMDEGYYGDEYKYRGKRPFVSMRAVSAPGKITKSNVKHYKTSVEATSECHNLVHKRVRMRRRDKMRPPDRKSVV